MPPMRLVPLEPPVTVWECGLTLPPTINTVAHCHRNNILNTRVKNNNF